MMTDDGSLYMMTYDGLFDVWWCIMMYDDVWWCVMMYRDVGWRIMMDDDG